MPDTILYTNGLGNIPTGNLLVTPTGGAQGKLADLLAAGGGSSGPVAATTLSASSTVTLSPANANVVIAPTGSGTHSMDNMAVGGTTPAAGKFTTITSATNAAIVLTNQTDGAGSGAGTLTTAPTAGDPAIWVPVTVNGVLRHIPAW